jgi:hypothetical protein
MVCPHAGCRCLRLSKLPLSLCASASPHVLCRVGRTKANGVRVSEQEIERDEWVDSLGMLLTHQRKRLAVQTKLLQQVGAFRA